jgi:hypothetical protein
VSRLAAAAGVGAVAAVSLLLFAAREPAPAPLATPHAARQPAAIAARAVPAPAAQPERPRDLVLHGVLMRGAQSRALFSVGGRAQEPYAIGDPVEGGWTVQAIREQEVVLANGSAQAVVNLAAGAPAAPAIAAIPVRTTASVPRLPGFVAGAPAPFTDAGASERNRRFLDAVHAHRGTGS